MEPLDSTSALQDLLANSQELTAAEQEEELVRNFTNFFMESELIDIVLEDDDEE